MNVLDIKDLTVEFPGRKSVFVAVDGVDLSVEAG